MPTLTLNYGTGSPITVACQKAGQAQPRRVGGKTNGFGGAEDSDIRAELMVVPLILAPKSLTEAAAIRALVALGAQFPCRGDVFLNGGATTVICSGKVSDELDPTASRVALNLTLFEIGAADYSPLETPVFLSNVVSPTDATMNLASTNGADDPFSAGLGNVTIMDAPEVIPTCPGLPNPLVNCPLGYSANAEFKWLSKPSPNGGWITRAPRLEIISAGSTADAWNIQDVKAKIFIVRSGVDVAAWETGYSNGNGGFAGGLITATAPAIVFLALVNDRTRVEIFGRAGLHQGYSVSGDYQVLTFGNAGAGSHYGRIVFGGEVLFQ